MLTETTGPALATDQFARSVQGLRDACVPPRRVGWRASLGPAVATDAARMAIVALLDALLRLMQEVLAQGRRDGAAAGLSPSRLDAVDAGPEMLRGDDTECAAPPCEPAPANATPQARRARRAPAPGTTPLPVQAVAAPPVAPTLPRSTIGHARRGFLPHLSGGRFGAQRARFRRVGSRPGHLRLKGSHP